ncbi:GNAT family N-acetyltransferase [Cellulophaga sp. L1A9]|uniref:GNAT family N-acetyltransferase n=1 Tax=Cellulophaga sp. L1A9 TaxID=2686362 RepID=UPI00131DD4C0|nr:GNAT family N-acetyltransferase [Cellulophaga sp. L1A9]
MKIVPITETNYPLVAKIYQEGISTGMATFETTVPSWRNWEKAHLNIGRIAIIDAEKMLGWASLAPVSNRYVYRGVAEVSVYVAENARGNGVGKKLLLELIKISEAHTIWTLQAGIMTTNIPSIQLHTSCGFRIIGYRENIGKLKETWLDNTLLERRSTIIGI